MTSGGGERDFTHQDANGPAQEIAGTLPNNFTLANTKAESKGEDRQEIYVSREIYLVPSVLSEFDTDEIAPTTSLPLFPLSPSFPSPVSRRGHPC